MDTIWTRRSNSSKLSLSTGTTATNGGHPSNEHPTRNYSTLGRRNGDTSSHSTKNPFNAMPPSTAVASPTAGASSAFGLGSGAFASFGSAKTPKTPGGALDFGSVVGGGAKTPTAEKTLKDLSAKTSKMSLSDSKTSSSSAKNPTPSPTHALRHSWAFWFRPPTAPKTVPYEKTLTTIASFDTAEDFWGVYRHLKRPSTLPVVSEYHIFKKGIRPIWEDDDNQRGGKWIVKLKKGVVDRYWENLILAITGDQFVDASDEICGAVLSVRNGEDILSVWARGDNAVNRKIRTIMIHILGFPADTKIEWKAHTESLQQRREIDEARKDKTNQNHHNARNGSKDESDKKQTS